MKNSVLEIKNVKKTFKVGNQLVPVLKGITFDVNKSDFLIILGPSGCGKSTLLHAIIGLEKPTEGEVRILNTNIYAMKNEDDISDFRKKHIGMVYQQPNWIKSLTVIENVAFPLLLLGNSREYALSKALTSLKEVSMDNWANYFPSELSSGQQQKVALSRAFISDPEIIITDEPTGNLDFESGKELMGILKEMNEVKQKTIIMVTHDLEYLKYSKKVIRMLDGLIVESAESEDEKNNIVKKFKGKK